MHKDMFVHILREQILILLCCEIHFIASTKFSAKDESLVWYSHFLES